MLNLLNLGNAEDEESLGLIIVIKCYTYQGNTLGTDTCALSNWVTMVSNYLCSIFMLLKQKIYKVWMKKTFTSDWVNMQMMLKYVPCGGSLHKMKKRFWMNYVYPLSLEIHVPDFLSNQYPIHFLNFQLVIFLLVLDANIIFTKRSLSTCAYSVMDYLLNSQFLYSSHLPGFWQLPVLDNS